MNVAEQEGGPAFHGYAPLGLAPADQFRPPLTVAISREAGARGRAIAERAAEQLDWQLLSQETLEYLTQPPAAYLALDHALPASADHWVEDQITRQRQFGVLADYPDMEALVRLILQLAAQGHCIILGRGAGHLLPPDSTLCVRLVAPESDRIAYVAQRDRLSLAEAQAWVRQRDAARQQFLSQKFRCSVNDASEYDLVLNTALLGIDACTEIIVTAVMEKESHLAQRFSNHGL